MNVEDFLSLLALFIKQVPVFWSDFTSTVRIHIFKYQNTSTLQESESLLEEKGDVRNVIDYERANNLVKGLGFEKW